MDNNYLLKSNITPQFRICKEQNITLILIKAIEVSTITMKYGTTLGIV